MINVSSKFIIEGKKAILATMHGKERVIQPLLESKLGLLVRIPDGFDTDRFGTFSREIERIGSQLDAARAKIAAAFECSSEARIGIASEGSFGAHPYIPFIPLGREIVVMIDRDSGLELVGHYADSATNFHHKTITTSDEALTFARQAKFPAQGLIVTGVQDDLPDPKCFLQKNIVTLADFLAAVDTAIKLYGKAHVETDMRAHRNPTRMRAIKRATIDLVRRFYSACPECMHPGFAVTERLFGLPCEWCGEPTNAKFADVLVCAGCGHRVERQVEATTAESRYCNGCNP